MRLDWFVDPGLWYHIEGEMLSRRSECESRFQERGQVSRSVLIMSIQENR